MYSIYSYGQMLADTPRMNGYVEALRKSINPESVVLDLGCGPGVFALLACEFGARRVYAVEPDAIIQVARDSAIANGFTERIEFFQRFSTEVTLPKPADIVISDLRGVLPLFEQNVTSIIDARKRLLASGGLLIPRRDTLWAALVEVADKYDEIVGPWETWGMDLSPAKKVLTNTWRKARIKPEQLLSEPVCWGILDYNKIESPDVTAEISCRAGRPGNAHGFCVWFDSELTDDVGFSNSPGEPELIYGNGLFLFPNPVEITAGDRVNIRLSADFISGAYVWRWDTTVRNDNDLQTKASFKQSTFYGAPLSPTQLRKQSAAYKPRLDQHGQIRSFILTAMTGEQSLEQIAVQLVEHFPTQYSDWKVALNDVTAVCLEFAE